MRSPVMLLFAFSAVASAQTDAPEAFRARPGKQVSTLGRREASVSRHRLVDVDMSLFDAGAAKRFLKSARRSNACQGRVRLSVFDGRSFVVAWSNAERTREPYGYVWSGKVEGLPLSHAVIVTNGRSITGNISAGDGILYQIRPAADGAHSIREVNQPRNGGGPSALSASERPI